ncbi:hypothetical protein FRX31_033535 [Thalictrum thalictroides]|uniref:Endonuclease/exonuclease/phosphatase domain-containing protein n=1 Tax=Thalictrum thalictroides TaxID=46969 RepID=A0A7J6UWE3_THATH|nr:hypothetical protein FRX31_033535 [Thalictrum thalictroides]
MKCISWNIRGIAKEDAQNRMRKLVRNYNPDYLGILEPMIFPKDIPYGCLQSLGLSQTILHNDRGDKKPNIWILYKNNCLVPQILSMSNQHITVEVNGVFLSVVHGHTYYVRRRELWERLSATSGKPWLLMGDFNSYLCNEEKKGVRKPILAGMEDFREFLSSNCLLEVPNKGIKFTCATKDLAADGYSAR